MKVALDSSWGKIFDPIIQQPYYIKLKKFLQKEYDDDKEIYPKMEHIFNAFKETPFYKIKVVILGQDPYHGFGQAHGLAFSVLPAIKIPPSLQNIFKELHADVGMKIPKNGCLYTWAEQGVFLINASLTVEANKPNSHAHIGWHEFTDAIIQEISNQNEGIIFMLWGKFAQDKKKLIDATKHYVLEAPHPSPLSAHKGFLGCGHFSKANNLLQQQGKSQIKWDL